MANCPVESLASGGLYWFVDLTARDPFFALPVITRSRFYYFLGSG
jgi:YidC/Oxa1 family membrane protein insertase